MEISRSFGMIRSLKKLSFDQQNWRFFLYQLRINCRKMSVSARIQMNDSRIAGWVLDIHIFLSLFETGNCECIQDPQQSDVYKFCVGCDQSRRGVRPEIPNPTEIT